MHRLVDMSSEERKRKSRLLNYRKKVGKKRRVSWVNDRVGRRISCGLREISQRGQKEFWLMAEHNKQK